MAVIPAKSILKKPTVMVAGGTTMHAEEETKEETKEALIEQKPMAFTSVPAQANARLMAFEQ